LPLAQQFRTLWWAQGPFLLILAFLLPVFLLDTIKLSHRFAGPICRLRTAMRAVAAGEKPTKLSFRDNDFWPELADEYNAMIEKLTDGKLSTEFKSEDECELVGANTKK
jgi:nitrogen fixation/metabolism regulation signal transduction histidine kinase